MKTHRFAVARPYAHLRHPLYAGTLPVVLGLAAAAGGASPALAPRLAALRPQGAPVGPWSAARSRANDEGGVLLAVAAAWLLPALRTATA